MVTAIQPRSYILSSNSPEALTIKSLFPETRLTFYTNDVPNFYISASNEQLLIIKNRTTVSAFDIIDGIPDFLVTGTIHATQFISTNPTRKTVVISNDNPNSTHQFAGQGYDGSTLNMQLPNRAAAFTFNAAGTANMSKEWMRIQQSPNTTAQVGIGTNQFVNSEALHVAGDTIIDGKIVINGNIEGQIPLTSLPPQILTVDSNTNRINCNIMPQNLVYTDTVTNQINTSILPTSYNFQYLKTNKNVGIGTRIALQKFHVQGSEYVSDRLGIGTYNPISRIHAVETSSVIPTVTIENNVGGDLLQANLSGKPSVIIPGTHPSIGIGTTTVDLNYSLYAPKSGYFGSNLICTNLYCSNSIYVPALNVKSLTGSPVLVYENMIQNSFSNLTVTGNVYNGYVPFVFNQGIACGTIYPLTSNNAVTFNNASVIIQKDLYLRSNPIITSDMRLKRDISLIDNPLKRLNYLHGYTFRHLDSEDIETGVLAQEVIDALPDAVSTLKDSNLIGVKYGSLVALLIEAIHELKNKIEIMEKKD